MKTGLCELETKIISVCEEKETLLEKIKYNEDKLSLKESELNSIILNSQEYVATVKNLTIDNETLTIANRKFQVSILIHRC